MANQAKLAILKTMIENEIVEILLKSRVDNIYLADGTTTLASKLAEMVASINEKAKTTDVESAISTAIANLRTELMGDGVPEAYDTFKELADYIAEHKEVSDALTEAIGSKASNTEFQAVKATVEALGALAKKSVVGEADLDEELKSKVNAAAEGNHSHSNKSLLDSYDQTNANIKDAVEKKHSHAKTDEEITDAVNKKHEHANKEVLDGIKATDVSAWNAKTNTYVQDSQPTDLKAGDIWLQVL